MPRASSYRNHPIKHLFLNELIALHDYAREQKEQTDEDLVDDKRKKK